MKKLPIGIQTFENLIRENYVYVDKTQFVSDIALQSKYYFLSRPRRFGKSLFLSTIKAAFEGKRELFEGLYVHDNWDWDQTNPVVHISFGSGVMRSIEELQNTFSYILDQNENKFDIETAYSDLKNRFSDLIQQCHAKYSRPVAILIDEYDKPILDNIDKPELAADIREELKNYYSVLKDSDPYIRLVFITGVSKFSKVSLFSGLNNLQDITIDERYSTLCGYTQKELEDTFTDYLPGVDLEEVKKWYNGYSWLGEKVYNPFDILLYLDRKEFMNYWFETGTPSFMIKLLRQGKYNIPEMEHLKAGEEIVGSFELEDIAVETLLFQAGYLTLTGFKQTGSFRRYELGYPNLEVKSSLCNSVLTHYSHNRLEKTRNQSDMLDALEDNDPEKMGGIFQAFFSSIPYEWYRKNQMAEYEGYYAAIVYCYFMSLGLDVRPETYSNKGRLDLVVRFEGRINVVEFKVIEQCGEKKALEQIKAKGYTEQFAGQETYLIGVEFSSEKRNIENFDWEKAG